MSWHILLAINLLCATVRESLNKKIVNKVNPFLSLFYIVLFNEFFLYLLQFVWYKNPPRHDLIVFGGGAFFVVAFVSYFKAVKISLSQSILFQSYSILITIALAAIFLGEGKYFDLKSLVGIKVFSGIILAFIALWFLLHVGSKKEERLEKKWFIYIIVANIFLGVGSFLSVLFLKKFAPVEILINQTEMMIVVLFLLIIVQKINFKVEKKDILLIFTNSLFSIIAVVAFYGLLVLFPVAKLYPLQQVSLVILTIISGVIFYKEKSVLTGKKLIGMLLGLSGILLLVTS